MPHLQPITATVMPMTAEAPIKDLPVPGQVPIGQIATIQPAQVAATSALQATAAASSPIAGTRKRSNSSGGGFGVLAVGLVGAVGLAYVIGQSGGR